METACRENVGDLDRLAAGQRDSKFCQLRLLLSKAAGRVMPSNTGSGSKPLLSGLTRRSVEGKRTLQVSRQPLPGTHA